MSCHPEKTYIYLLESSSHDSRRVTTGNKAEPMQPQGKEDRNRKWRAKKHHSLSSLALDKGTRRALNQPEPYPEGPAVLGECGQNLVKTQAQRVS